MTTLRGYFFKKAFLLGIFLVLVMFLFSYFTTKKVRDVYHKNLVYLSVLMEKNFQFFLDLYGSKEVVEYQISEAVARIPEVKAIYIRYGPKEYYYPKSFNKKEVLKFCPAPSEDRVVVKDDFLLVCLPLKEEYASQLIEAKVKGIFVVVFNRAQEEKFIASWMGSTLILTFLLIALGILVITIVWSELGGNFLNLERLVNLVQESLSSEDGKFADRELLMTSLLRTFTLKEFREIGEILLKNTKELKLLNEKVRELAITDPLTNLYNRNYLKLFVEDKLVPLWRRERFPLSVAILDLDNFKWINDTFGHQKGDEILREWGRIIKEELRGSDVAIRFGGEEILLILPYTKKESAGKAVERIKERLLSTDFGIGKRVSFSAGVSSYPDDFRDLIPLEEFIRLADERLYKAKNSGKNRVVLD
jgi:diguanylate cyclase (GGDEF)-like protein